MNRRHLLKMGSAIALTSTLTPSMGSAKTTASDISVRWLGAAMMELNIGGFRILTDPCLGEGKKAFQMPDPNEMFDLSKGPNMKFHERLTAFPGMKLPDYDLVLLSHAHEDHFDQKAQAWLSKSLPLLCPSHDLDALTQKGFSASALAHGEKREFTVADTKVSITSIPAIHSLNQGISDILGLGNGYWIEAVVRGKTTNIYWAGDTFLADPVWNAMQSHAAPDLFIPHIGAVGINGALGQLSMNGQQALDFAARIKADKVLPVHHSTYVHYQEPVSEMIKLHDPANAQYSLHVLEEGSVLTL
ncbi:MBL fold metallo-hydrolase [Ahrensia marina]|uniref:Transcriptional initiation protein Tat n=1 Tax=Ahrensia marina TaxID=1514904 RepID=A0A0N0E745_9HYPH|nr:MBL fold metallo-hydrolase [Ahrensia marina]KPB00768.1 transcriptional initiation protein Tat [Ahrensia marina]